jgi:hypothetical protein
VTPTSSHERRALSRAHAGGSARTALTMRRRAFTTQSKRRRPPAQSSCERAADRASNVR